jgi:hypothetical protein
MVPVQYVENYVGYTVCGKAICADTNVCPLCNYERTSYIL